MALTLSNGGLRDRFPRLTSGTKLDLDLTMTTPPVLSGAGPNLNKKGLNRVLDPNVSR